MSNLSHNPRFVNYARYHGNTPEQQLAHDRQRYPGGVMTGYVLWNRSRIVMFSHIEPRAFTCGGLTDHESYDRWLTDYVTQARRERAA